MELSFYSIKLFSCFTAFVIKILSRRTQYHIQLISDIFLTKQSDQNLAHCWLGNVYWTFNFALVIRLFETLKIFYFMGRMGRSPNMSFKFLQTLWAFRTYIYIYTCMQNKSCRQHSYGFQNLMSSWGSWSKISKLGRVGDFFFF